MSDAWEEIQAIKSKRNSLREKVQKRKKERQDILSRLAGSESPSSSTLTKKATSTISEEEQISNSIAAAGLIELANSGNVGDPCSLAAGIETSIIHVHAETVVVSPDFVKQIEHNLLRLLGDSVLSLPISAIELQQSLSRKMSVKSHVTPPLQTVINLLLKFNTQLLISVTTDGENTTTGGGGTVSDVSMVNVVSVEHVKLAAMLNDLEDVGTPESENLPSSEVIGISGVCGKILGVTHSPMHASSLTVAPVSPASEEIKDGSADEGPAPKLSKITEREEKKREKKAPDIMSLLSMPSIREKETKKVGEEIVELLSKPTAKERSLVDRFKSNGTQVQEFCPHGTRVECIRINSGSSQLCTKLHFNKIIQKHTDETLGDCSFLNTCFHMDTCKYVHYEVDNSGAGGSRQPTAESAISGSGCSTIKDLQSTTVDSGVAPRLYPPQWIQCDLRYLDMSVLGKFAVIMADPPWDIHMELPYGTMSDDEMRQLGVPCLQDNGLIFLWVTGRAMELGRECLQLWGYERLDELIWVKTNQLQRIIRTGRTGHWLNHGKEHCLVGRKGDISNMNRGLDCDVLVAEVRATSHKPDEIYGIIERLSPGTRKIELFGRPHNVQPNWITLGNQVDGVRIVDPELIKNFKRRYPDGNCMKPPDT